MSACAITIAFAPGALGDSACDSASDFGVAEILIHFGSCFCFLGSTKMGVDAARPDSGEVEVLGDARVGFAGRIRNEVPGSLFSLCSLCSRDRVDSVVA